MLFLTVMNEPTTHTESLSIEERIDILTHRWPRFFRWFVIATKAFLFHHGTIRAAALTYTSFLAVVPLLILLTTITLAMGMGSFFSDYLPILDHLLSLTLESTYLARCIALQLLYGVIADKLRNDSVLIA